MRYAIISDIHSNLEALTKALEIIETKSIDEIICLGDIVGYGANPNECVALVREHCRTVIKGNHDEAILDIKITSHFNNDARSAAEWTLTQISAENVSYLRTLALTAKKEDLLFVHASPCSPGHWRYILDEITASNQFHCFTEKICFIGHTHMPVVFSAGGRIPIIKKEQRFIINVGSIGQPRDGNKDLSFGIFDTDKWSYENVRYPYDVETAVRKILGSNLPQRLGRRLLVGL